MTGLISYVFASEKFHYKKNTRKSQSSMTTALFTLEVRVKWLIYQATSWLSCADRLRLRYLGWVIGMADSKVLV